MDATLYPRRIAPLYGLIIGLLPVIAVFSEFWWQLHPLGCLAFIYALCLLVYYTLREYRGEVQFSGHEGGHGLTRSAHLVLVAIFALTFFGVLRLIYTLAAGHQRWQFAIGDSLWQLPVWLTPEKRLAQDLVWYCLALALFCGVYWLAHRFPGVHFDFHLRWRLNRIDVLIIAGLSLFTALGLMGYMYLFFGTHDAMAMFGATAGGTTPWRYWLSGIAFALANALVEEFWFRGVLLGALKPLLPPVRVIAVQAVVFGLIHWFGAPQGVFGVILAGAWGALLGWWVLKRGSLWPAVIVHFIADIVIFAYVN